MLKLGEKQVLKMKKRVDFGIYLAEDMETEERVLLPKQQVPEEIEIGDELEVFLYKDSKDRLIATTREPKIMLGQTALLEVVEVGKIGAFMDWGLEKDLLLPFAEQTVRVKPKESYLVALYIDKSSRLCATMKVYDYLELESPYKKEDTVQGIVYEVSETFGTYVAVDNKYSAMLPAIENNGTIHPGDVLTARVAAIKEDGKIDISIRDKAYLQMDEDAESVYGIIEEYAGVLPFTDKASPEIIRREFGLSKNAFKRAVGRLYKEGKVEITDKNIRIIDKEK